MSHVLVAFLLTFGTSLNADLQLQRSGQPVHRLYKQTPQQREADLRTWVGGYGESFGGIEYQWGGQTTAGFDCSGFTKFVFESYGINISGHSGTQATEGRKVSLQDAQPGDLIFFGRNGRVSHVGIICENTADGIVAVHSTSSRGIMKENVSKSSYWKSRIMFARDVISRYIDEDFSKDLINMNEVD